MDLEKKVAIKKHMFITAKLKIRKYMNTKNLLLYSKTVVAVTSVMSSDTRVI